MEKAPQTKGDRFRELLAEEMADYLIHVQGHSALETVNNLFNWHPMEAPSLPAWEKRDDWAAEIQNWLEGKITQDEAEKLWKELAEIKDKESRMDAAFSIMGKFT